MFCYPTRNTLSHPQAQFSQIFGVRHLGGAQHDFIGLMFHQVYQACIALRYLRRETDNLSRAFRRARDWN